MTKDHIPPNWKQANMVTYIFQAPEDTDPIMYMVDNKIAKESLDADTIKQLYDSMGARGLTHIELDILAQVPNLLENQTVNFGLINNRIDKLYGFMLWVSILLLVGSIIYLVNNIFG